MKSAPGAALFVERHSPTFEAHVAAIPAVLVVKHRHEPGQAGARGTRARPATARSGGTSRRRERRRSRRGRPRRAPSEERRPCPATRRPHPRRTTSRPKRSPPPIASADHVAAIADAVYDLANASGCEQAELMMGERLARDRHERLRNRLRDGSQPGAEPSGEDRALHQSRTMRLEPSWSKAKRNSVRPASAIAARSRLGFVA